MNQSGGMNTVPTGYVSSPHVKNNIVAPEIAEISHLVDELTAITRQDCKTRSNVFPRTPKGGVSAVRKYVSEPPIKDNPKWWNAHSTKEHVSEPPFKNRHKNIPHGSVGLVNLSDSRLVVLSI